MSSIVSTSARANRSLAASLARRAAHVLLASLAAFLLVVPGLSDAREGADPGINRPYLHPDFAQWVERFESPGREVYDRRMAILSATGVKPGMRTADIGAGTARIKGSDPEVSPQSSPASHRLRKHITQPHTGLRRRFG